MNAKILLCALSLCATSVGVTACNDDKPMDVSYTMPPPYDPRTSDIDPITDETIKTQVVAHRGYWLKGGYSTQNTVKTFMEADRIGVYGAEFDIHLTSDGVVVASHDPTVKIGSVTYKVNEVTWEFLQKNPVDEGEIVESLEQFLDAGAKGKIKFIIELKNQSTSALDLELADKTIAMVKAKGLESRTEYISFAAHIIKHISSKVPAGTKMQFLASGYDKATLENLGATGIDASKGSFTEAHIKDAKKDGFTTNVWTVDDQTELLKFVNYGVDFITTDDPWLAIEVIEAAKRGKTITKRKTEKVQ